MPLVLGGSAVVTPTYSVDNSCRFNEPDSPYLNFTTSSSFTSNQKFTFSCWIKSIPAAADETIFTIGSASPAENVFLYVQSGGGVTLYGYGPGMGRATNGFQLLKDPSAWYNLVFVVDTTESTAGDRQLCYINGYRVPNASWANYGDYGLNDTLNAMTSGKVIHIGANSNNVSEWNGYLAEAVFIDGLALTASDFGEYNEASPAIWQPKDPTDLTFGTNGFWLDFADSAALGNDVSGNNNDFTVTNLVAADQSQDSPTNNFATFNPLENYYPDSTFSQGNNTLVTGASPRYAPNMATMGLTSGKWYWETKSTSGVASEIQGIRSSFSTGTSNYVGENVNDYGYFTSGTVISGGVSSAYGSTYALNDIIGTYVDLDGLKIYWAINGTIQNSGTGVSITAAAASTVKGAYFPAWSDWSSAQTYTYHMNFGNGCFGNTVVTSSNADANGYGLFEYSPNDGGSASFDSSAKNFLTICTKNLGSDGG